MSEAEREKRSPNGPVTLSGPIIQIDQFFADDEEERASQKAANATAVVSSPLAIAPKPCIESVLIPYRNQVRSIEYTEQLIRSLNHDASQAQEQTRKTIQLPSKNHRIRRITNRIANTRRENRHRPKHSFFPCKK
eukprot:IDg9628t1